MLKSRIRMNTELDLFMGIPERTEQEGLVEYAERLSGLYMRISQARTRKLKGQFFTPKQVSTFMANMFEIHHYAIRLLDPGAGTGILTAAFCERLLSKDKTVNLTIDVYENDPDLLPLLEMVLGSCKTELEARGHNVKHNVYEQDFILHNERYLREFDLFWTDENRILYDLAICNPPYYKLNKDSPQSTVMTDLVSGQPNIYALFMALCASMVKPEGEMVFITPRSFCSGLYYKKFREWFLGNVQIADIHIFESRKGIFDKDEVLQENVIIKAKRLEGVSKYRRMVVSTSKGKDFAKLRKIEVECADVICHRNTESFIRIPTSSFDIDILHIVDAWPNTLKDLGLEISTGPVVAFRAEKYLLHDPTGISKSAPLLWMHNMQDMGIVWPLRKNRKASSIRVCKGTMPLLLPVKNYVLVKRFSSKEQKRRLYASVLSESEFPCETVGIENHVNYIHRPNGNLSVYEAFGIAAMLNTAIVDNFFRSLNGSTQVNATDIRSLPFPSIEDIGEIGKLVYESQPYPKGFDLDNVVAEILGIDVQVIGSQTRATENEQN